MDVREKFDCCHINDCGFCRLYSNIDVDVPCPKNADCDGYIETEGADDGK